MGKDQDLIQAVKDNDGVAIQKILQKHVKSGKTKIIGNNKKFNINFQDGDGMSALHQAALMGSTDVIKLLLEGGATPELKDNKGMVALHYAAWQGRPEPVQVLLLKQSPINEQASNGETPLHLACQHGHIHVVKLLLNHHADPTICNKELKSPLDLACEFGRGKVVEQLLRSNLCQKLLEDSPTDTLDNGRTTCLHLAARNGHCDIVRLLIQGGMNINRSTLNGTCLHEASLYGKIDVVKLLLDCGIDVNKPNSYDQTALDIVNKFTATRAAKELKRLLKEASFAVQARAVKDYFNLYDPSSLAFKEGDIITVLEQGADGIWKGYVASEGRMAKTGLFPSNHVVLVDAQALKQQFKTTPVPDLLNRGPYPNGHLYHNGCLPSDSSSCSSYSTDDSYPPPPHITNSLGPPSNSVFTYGPPPPSPGYISCGPAPSPGYNSGSVHSPAHSSGGPPPPSPGYIPTSPLLPCSPHRESQDSNYHTHGVQSYPLQHSQYLGGRPSGYYPGTLPVAGEQHAEWVGPVQGAGPGGDMRAGSPAKDQNQNHSPAHSNRNSAASSDSGRGFSTGHLEPKVVTVVGQHRLSGQSYESGVSSRQSYHSTSSSSLGSLDRLEESGGISSTINVQQLIQAGVPDKEVLQAWLHDLHFEDYYSNFVQAGYDMPTISRMTPEDLTAIGITKPAHRKRLKAEIAKLHINDGIPDFRPHDLIEWLHLLGLGSYHETLVSQGYDNIEYITDITWEDLEEIGIKKLGHQKKMMLAIDRLKRITSGTKRLSSVEPRRPSIELLEPPPPAPPIGRWSGEIAALPPHMYDGGLGIGAKPKKSPSGDSISTTGSGGSGSSSSQGSGDIRMISLSREDPGIVVGSAYARQNSNSSGNHQPDVVTIQVKRHTRSSSSSDDKDIEGQAMVYQSFQGPTGKSGPGDPTVPHAMSMSDPGIPVVPMLPKPGSMIVAKVKRSSHEYVPEIEMEKHESECNSDGNKIPSLMSNSVTAVMERSGENYASGSLKRNGGNGVLMSRPSKEHIYDQPQLRSNSSTAVPHASKPQTVQAPHSPKLQVIITPHPLSSQQPVAPHSPKTTPTTPPIKPPILPKPASPLHVATPHDSAVQSTGSPTNRAKKAPPPPPKRTHSIRSDAPPASVVKPETSCAFSVTTTATVNTSSATSSSNVPAAGTNIGHSNNPSTKQTAHLQEKMQPQGQAFASCVKSLSERFGKKSEAEGSQESLSSDSDEFPPPPPPIAMDIITPKLHNYGIPSKADKDYVLHTPPHVMHTPPHVIHTPPHVMHTPPHVMHNHPPPLHSKDPPGKDYGFQNRLRQQPHASSESPPAARSDALTATGPLQKRISPGRDVPASSVSVDMIKNGEPNLYTPNLVDKRSESTTSFESTTSSSSTDSNTLPFANENVGTIKQRATAAKPSIVQTFDTDGQRNVDLNMAVFALNSANRTRPPEGAGIDPAVSRTGVTNASNVNAHRLGVNIAKGPENFVRGSVGGTQASTSVAAGLPVGAHGTRQAPSHEYLQQQQQAIRHQAPVPSKKPVPLPAGRPKPPFQSAQQQLQPQQYNPTQSATVAQRSTQQQQEPAPPAVTQDSHRSTETGDVLNDIDNMLQDLTDELDAMLLEETAS